jgi:chemotaxis protein MotB
VASPPPPDEKKGEGWIVSYADLMTLLFAAFVVLYGLKPEGEVKAILGVMSSIQEAFVEMPERIPQEEKEGPIHDGNYVFDFFKADKLTEPVIKKYRHSEFVTAVINKDLETLQKVIDKTLGKPDRPSAAPAKADVISVAKVEKGFKIILASTFLFDSGTYEIGRDSYRAVERIGEALKDIDARILVDGHTDNLPADGPLSNWALSSLRATSVARVLMDRVGIPAEKVAIAGYADKHPRATNMTPEGRSLNRRVEIQVKYD